VYWKTSDIVSPHEISVLPNNSTANNQMELHILRVFNLTYRDNGWISCFADNMAGKEQMEARVIIDGNKPFF
jgi:hypothetical protein